MPSNSPETEDHAGGGQQAGDSLLRPSKTRRKKDSHDLQDLGEALVALPDNRLAGLPMDESLRDAILAYKRTRTHEGRRRQMQYVGKLMRRSDPEPLREAVAAMQLGSAKESLALHETERWRAELIASDGALTRWMEEHPDTDLQMMRSVIRAARKDAAAQPEQRSGKAFRELFKLIKAHSTAPLADDAAEDHDSDDD
jgi:ribosome-associated protein